MKRNCPHWDPCTEDHCIIIHSYFCVLRYDPLFQVGISGGLVSVKYFWMPWEVKSWMGDGSNCSCAQQHGNIISLSLDVIMLDLWGGVTMSLEGYSGIDSHQLFHISWDFLPNNHGWSLRCLPSPFPQNIRWQVQFRFGHPFPWLLALLLAGSSLTVQQ